jgi:hypothetical protein
VIKTGESHLELRELLLTLPTGPSAQAAAIAHIQKLTDYGSEGDVPGLIVDLPYELVYPRDDPRGDIYALSRVRIADDAFEPRDLALYIAFALRRRILGLLACTWWCDGSNWLTQPVNGDLRLPTYEAYLRDAVIARRQCVHGRYTDFRAVAGF